MLQAFSKTVNLILAFKINAKRVVSLISKIEFIVIHSNYEDKPTLHYSINLMYFNNYI